MEQDYVLPLAQGVTEAGKRALKTNTGHVTKMYTGKKNKLTTLNFIQISDLITILYNSSQNKVVSLSCVRSRMSSVMAQL